MIENTLRDAVLSERISETSYWEMLAYLEKQKEQKPAEWSEEDEKMKNNTILSLQSLIDEGINTEFIKGVEKEITWLKSLRHQPKPTCPHYSEGYGCDISPTKSCATCDKNPLPHWKPSEEQIDALNSIILNGSFTYVGQVQDLISLKDDIKKL